MRGVSVVPRSPGGRDGALVHLGRKAAQALLRQDPGDPEEQTGWRGALQDAAHVSNHHPDVLGIADDLYRTGHTYIAPDPIRKYAETELTAMPDGPGHWLLQGLLEHLQNHSDTPGCT